MLFQLPQAVDRVAERTPDSVALVCRGDELTYGELYRRANALAHRLVSLGVARGDRIGIYADKTLDAAVAIYGIMKSSACYVPLDPRAPLVRVRQIVSSCDMAGIVTDAAHVAKLEELHGEGSSLRFAVGPSSADIDVPVIGWDSLDLSDGGAPPDTGVMEQDLAYVLYTSGSTGVPKGIMHTHRSALSWAEVAASTYGFNPDDRLSNHAPLHFDLSTLDYFAAAVAGSTTVVIPDEYTKLPASLSKLMSDEKLTVFYCVPFALIQLLLNGALQARDMSRLRLVLFGGEPFPPKHLRALMDLWPGARFCNVYGPTEVNGVTYFFLPGPPDGSDASVPIGRPYPNVEAKIVDPENQDVADGDVGELLVRTPTMMQGYWGHPELTEQATFRRSGAGTIEEVFHRTGDLVQPLSDGNLRFVGRKDRQVKVRGHRVELDEIEGALGSHEQVAEAAVYLVPEGERHVLRSSVTSKFDGELEASDLERFVRGLLPWYAVPESIDVIDAFPRTSTGKIDRLALCATATATRTSP